MSQIIFKSAPLPFIGQKRKFLKSFEKMLDDNIAGDGEDWTIVDAFGGSGLLSHTAKRLKPKARVIFNDYDNYAERLAHIDEINALRGLLFAAVGETPKQSKINKETQSRIIDIIENFNGYKDLHCINSWLLFSGNQSSTFESLFKKQFWNCIPSQDYKAATGYLDGVEVVCQPFDELLPQYTENEKALFVLDPPYLCTAQEAYRKDNYFDLISFLKLTNLVRPPYAFFSSSKSEFIRFIDFAISHKTHNWHSFAAATRIEINAQIHAHNSYKDNLVFKFAPNLSPHNPQGQAIADQLHGVHNQTNF